MYEPIIKEAEAQLRELHRLLPDRVSLEREQERYCFELPDGFVFMVKLPTLRQPNGNMLDQILDGLHNALCRLLPVILPSYTFSCAFDQSTWCADLIPSTLPEKKTGQQHFTGASPFMGLAIAQAVTFALEAKADD